MEKKIIAFGADERINKHLTRANRWAPMIENLYTVLEKRESEKNNP